MKFRKLTISTIAAFMLLNVGTVSVSYLGNSKSIPAIVQVSVAHAEDAPAPASTADQALEAPVWLKYGVETAVGLPYVGPVLVEVLKWVGVVAALLTALSAFLLAVSRALAGIVKLVPMLSALDKVKALVDKLLPYAMYLSVFNVQKDPKKK